MTAKKTYSKSTLLGFYRDMLLIRKLEERIGYLFLEGVISGTLHQSLGQEAVAVGVCSALNKEDIVTSGHRPHGHAIAKGVDPTAFMLELFGKPGGCCGGKGGSMHVGDLSVGMIPSIAIVGANIPVGTGAGLAFKLRKESRVAVCFTGDGGVAEGAFHEAVNLAAVWNLPVIYVIENNQYAASTHYSKNTKLSHLSDIAAAYGISGVSIDGNDVLKVYETACDAVDRARTGGGPTIVEAMTYRLTGHNRRDPCNYMPQAERERAEANEPIHRFEEYLITQGYFSAIERDSIKLEIEALVERAVEMASAAEDPHPEDALQDVYA
jgi:pyruvate dehydrogenase E1 component alpha subunit